MARQLNNQPPRSPRSPFRATVCASDEPTPGTVTRMFCIKGLVAAVAGSVKDEDAYLTAKRPVMSAAFPSRKAWTCGENCRRNVTVSDLLVGPFKRPNFPPPKKLALSPKARLYFPALPTKALPASAAGPA